MHNDPCFGEGVEVVATLSLSACSDFEFNCADGQCVPMTARCDGRIDCDDSTGKHKRDAVMQA